MNKLKEASASITEAANLINEMKAEIDELRYIVARYHAKYGEDISTSTLILSNDISFNLSAYGCQKLYHGQLNIESRYQRILKKIDDFK
jgi:hypothetical protein